LEWVYQETDTFLRVCQPCFFEELARALPQIRTEVFMEPPLGHGPPALAKPAPEPT
jgi:hypothetical protein